MAILKVARMGHPVLRAKALPVPPDQILSAPIQRLIDDMFETMREYAGIGLAAPQVHEGVRMFVAGCARATSARRWPTTSDMPFIALINPEITLVGRAGSRGVGRLPRIPDIRGLVPRAAEVRVQAFDRTGTRVVVRRAAACRRA